jgi:Flp pilus assembly protein TadD
VLVVVLAVVVAAFLAVCLRAAVLIDRSGGPLAANAEPHAAIRDFKRARLLNPETAPDTGIAFAEMALGRFGVARAELRRAIRREPRDYRLWTALSIVESRAGRLPAARRAYAEARRLNPLIGEGLQ